MSGAVYRYGVISVDLLRQYRSEGFLQGERLAGALEELGYIEDESSRAQRRSLLVDALSELDPDIRQAAAQGLTYLADAAAREELLTAVRSEQNPLVKAQMEDAIESCSASA